MALGRCLFSNNAVTILAANITATATSFAVASGAGALFPQPALPGDFFVVTLISAATQNPAAGEIVYVQGRTGDTFTNVLRAQEGTAAQAFSANDLVQELNTAGVMGKLAQTGRVALTANLTLYVAPTGSDSNNGSIGFPFATLQHAYNVIASNYDLSGFSATISVADSSGGGYSAGITTSQPIVGGSQVNVVGDTANPQNCVINVVNGNGFVAAQPGVAFLVSGMLIEASGTGVNGFGISSINGGQIHIGASVQFGACGSAHMNAQFEGQVFLDSAYSIVGAAPIHYSAHDGGEFFGQSLAITMSGTLNFSTAFAVSTAAGNLNMSGMTYTGGTITGQRYNATKLGLIQTGGGGANYFPGSVAGYADSWTLTNTTTFSLYS